MDEKEEIKAILERMRKANMPAIFLAFDGEHFINVKNCKLDSVAQLVVNQIESSDEMKEAFVLELEKLTIDELTNASENG